VDSTIFALIVERFVTNVRREAVAAPFWGLWAWKRLEMWKIRIVGNSLFLVSQNAAVVRKRRLVVVRISAQTVRVTSCNQWILKNTF
jgi:hypothetical protein